MESNYVRVDRDDQKPNRRKRGSAGGRPPALDAEL
jgi:hypothetical protein